MLTTDAQPLAKARRVIDGVHEDGAALGEAAVTRGALLAREIRDDSVHAVAAHTDTLTRAELIALVVALAAMVPADVDPAAALEWVEVPFPEWSRSCVDHERARFEAGARDITARTGLEEHLRRSAARRWAA